MATGNQTPGDVASNFAAQKFLILQLISQVSTITLARVVSCTNDGGIVPTGTLTVQPLVNMLAGDGTAFQHGQLFNVPYSRIQGGANAVIIDPQPGDIGIIGFCERDISAVKKSHDIANPGSLRQYSKSDGVWLATLWTGEEPAQYVVMNAAGVHIVSPAQITLQAPTINLQGEVVQTAGDVSMAQDLTVAGTITGDTDVIAGTISGKTHTHGGVTAGGANTAVPNP